MGRASLTVPSHRSRAALLPFRHNLTRPAFGQGRCVVASHRPSCAGIKPSRRVSETRVSGSAPSSQVRHGRCSMVRGLRNPRCIITVSVSCHLEFVRRCDETLELERAMAFWKSELAGESWSNLEQPSLLLHRHPPSAKQECNYRQDTLNLRPVTATSSPHLWLELRARSSTKRARWGQGTADSSGHARAGIR